tara:strand:- start:307 stop:465 length:159 start_codon:yes stop_codon:yes gene_type:complete
MGDMTNGTLIARMFEANEDLTAKLKVAVDALKEIGADYQAREAIAKIEGEAK